MGNSETSLCQYRYAVCIYSKGQTVFKKRSCTGMVTKSNMHPHHWNLREEWSRERSAWRGNSWSCFQTERDTNSSQETVSDWRNINTYQKFTRQKIFLRSSGQRDTLSSKKHKSKKLVSHQKPWKPGNCTALSGLQESNCQPGILWPGKGVFKRSGRQKNLKFFILLSLFLILGF